MNKLTLKYQERAIKLDRTDTLASFKAEFYEGGDQSIYLDGNSLGKLPLGSRDLLMEVVDKQWGMGLIRSWNEHWIDLNSKIASKIANIVGAREDEIFLGDSTSVNLYKLVYSALSFDKSKTKIISDSLNFPTDLYIIQGLIKSHFNHHQLQLIDNEKNVEVSASMIFNLLDQHTSLVCLSHVTFKNSFLYDMNRVTKMVHYFNSLIVWDLSHSVGIIPIELNKSGTDMAVGCTYKYLNGGPGAPAFLYVKKELQDKMVNPVWAWFSHANPFGFSLNYEPAKGIEKFATGTPSILSLAAIEPGIDITLRAGLDKIREKSVAQSSFMIEMINDLLIPEGFVLSSPLDSFKRGSHVSVQHPEAYRICQALISPNNGSKPIIPDFRPPNNIRLGISPLYNTFSDIYETITRLKQIVEKKQFNDYSPVKNKVT